MKKLIIIYFLLTPFLLFAQESAIKNNRFSIGLITSPNYSFRIVEAQDNSLQDYADMTNDATLPALGFNTGIVAQYLILKNVEIQIGLQFSRRSHARKQVPFRDNPGTVLGLADLQYRYHYLELPLQVNYRIVNKKFFSYISAGVSINYLLTDRIKMSYTYNNGDMEVLKSNTASSDFNNSVVSVLGGIGIGYNINEKLNLRLEPLFRYSLVPLKDTPINEFNQFYHSFGGQIGANVKL